MELRPRKKVKYGPPVRRTKEQRRLLKDAASESSVSVDANDPFALLLLDAAKTNSNCTWLTISITMNKKIPREFLEALAQFLVAQPCVFKSLFFDGAHRDSFVPSVSTDEAGDNYVALITAMVESQSILKITIKKCLPLKLEEAIIEVFRQKSSSISLELDTSMILAVHPMAFGRMLATTKCLYHLILRGDQPYDRSHLRDGLQMNQSLKGIQLWGACETGLLNDILDCTEGIQSLTVQSRLDSTSAALLSKFVSKHKKLAYLNVGFTPDAVKALCKAVSCSQSLTELVMYHHSHVSAISWMLQHTTSLQKLHLVGHCDEIDLETLAIGLGACKTLVRLQIYKAKIDVKAASALLKAVLTNHNLSEITIGGILCPIHMWVCQPGNPLLSSLQMELAFYLSFNKQGRALLQADVPLGVWPCALKKAGSSSLPDALYSFLQEMPVLMRYDSQRHYCTKDSVGSNGCACFKLE